MRMVTPHKNSFVSHPTPLRRCANREIRSKCSICSSPPCHVSCFGKTLKNAWSRGLQPCDSTSLIALKRDDWWISTSAARIIFVPGPYTCVWVSPRREIPAQTARSSAFGWDQCILSIVPLISVFGQFSGKLWRASGLSGSNHAAIPTLFPKN